MQVAESAIIPIMMAPAVGQTPLMAPCPDSVVHTWLLKLKVGMLIILCVATLHHQCWAAARGQVALICLQLATLLVMVHQDGCVCRGVLR